MEINIDLGNIWEMLSAIGTISAVVVSLWLARRSEKVNLKLDVEGIMETKAIMEERARGNAEQVISFECFNYSKYPITLSSMGFILYKRSYPKFARKYFRKHLKKKIYFLKPDPHPRIRLISKFPAKVESMETKSIILRRDYFKENLLENIGKQEKENAFNIEFYVKDAFGNYYYNYFEVEFEKISQVHNPV